MFRSISTTCGLVCATRPTAVAVIVRPDIMWSRSRAEDALAEADQLRKLLEAGAQSELPADGDLTRDYAEELVAAIRADRDAR